MEKWGERMCVKERVSWKGIPNHPLKILSEKERFGSGTGWYGSIIIWVEINGVKISSRTKSKTFGSRKVVVMGGDEGRDKIF